MYLKNIEVQGFKSFAQKINFEFHNGITGIVGPNGSGKSNVADAVRWVLGEQSAKQLRGGNMQDVIFSGTQTRKALSFASVAITLDNSDHVLPIDFSEVTVTRRLYRSGESEYLINQSACRLRDIQELFYDTGIGKEGYSIIGQGQIDKILSGKPEERRELFDEAAGIVKFKRRKTATLKKLEDEEQNLVRVTDILSELERQIGPLEKQAEAARKYLSLRERQHRLDANFFLSEEARISRELSQIEEKLSVSTQELEQRKKEYEDIRREYDHLEADIRQLDLSLGELREKAQKSALTRQQQTGRIDVLKEQILAQIHSLEIRAARLDAIGTELSSRQGEESELQKEKNLLQTQIRKLQEELSLQEEQLDEVHNDEAACEKAITEGKDEVFSLLEERSNTKGKLQRFEALMEQINIRKAQISQRLIQGKSDEVQIGQQAQKAQEDILRIQGDISELANRQTEAEKSLEELTATIHGQNDQLQIGQAAFHRESARLESLQNMAERYDGYGSSIRRVMEQKAKVPGLLGVVADLIQTDKKYELAIETALGGSIQHIVTDQVDVARQMIDYLKKNRLGRATFLPLESLSEKKEFRPVQALSEKGVLGTADTLVQTQDRFRILAESLLGRILVVDTMDNAVLIARKYHYSLRLVTLEGDSFSPGGSMTGGAYKNNSNLLGRRREIEELKASIQALEKDLNEMAETIEKNREKRNLVRDSLTQLASDLAEKQVELNTATLLLESQREKMTQIQDEYRAIAHSQEELKEDESRIRQESREVNDQLNASARDEGEINDFLEEKQKELDELRLKEQALNTQAEQTRLSFSTSSQKAEYIQASLNRLAQEQKALLAEQEEIQRSLGQVERERQEKEEEIQGLQESIGMLMTQEEEARREILLQEKIKEEKSAVHKGLFSRSDETSGQISLLDKECYRLKSQAERLEERKETQISYLWDEYQMTPHEAEEFRMDPVPDVKEMQKELGSIREEIRKLGAVNPNAIEEYKEQSERYGFMSGQYQDLVQAKKTLEGIILELDEGMRKQFTEKFREIQKEFDHTFQELFGGGKGTLLLEEDQDILEAGIRIISQPPGKKLQNMMQLSGGEKALTAIALLFAIQNLKPSPFCLLDEIEAALDDSNVGRFAGYLQKLTKSTQFIIITHRRGTMNAADRLYGITMQEKGVSALVSVDLVESQLS